MTRIPSIIHQIWIQGREALPPRYAEASRIWRTKHPQWEYRLWDDHSLVEFMQRTSPEWLPLYECQDKPISKADVGRYAVLQEFGGIYADLDTRCVRPVDQFLARNSASLIVQIYGMPWIWSRYRPVPYDRVANSVIACVSRHPIWNNVRCEIVRRNQPEALITWRTGPEMFWPQVKDFSETHPHQVRFVGRPQILTAFFLPRFYMRWYGWTRRNACILDYNDSGRATVSRIARQVFSCGLVR